MPNYPLTSEHFKFIGALKFDPGYLLLLDLIQAQVDDVTDDLSDPNKSNQELVEKLRYWQALRKILHELKVQPENFSHLLAAEPKEPTELSGQELWAPVNSVEY